VLAGAVRLLDRGFFRIGNEAYAEENDTYGLATMKRRHVRLLPGNVLVFDYTAKGGKRHLQSIVDPKVFRLIAELKGRRGGGDELLAYKVDRRWRDVHSSDVNAYIKAAIGADFTAKDFRTWSATVLAAVAVAVSGRAAASPTARKRAIRRAVQEVAFYLGNTPAVCRASYIDPRVFDRFDAGVTIGGALDSLGDVDLGEPAIQGPVEAAVIDLLAEDGQLALERLGHGAVDARMDLGRRLGLACGGDRLLELPRLRLRDSVLLLVRDHLHDYAVVLSTELRAVGLSFSRSLATFCSKVDQ